MMMKYFAIFYGRIIRKGTTDHWTQAVAQLVEATSRKLEGSIPDGVIGIFH
jgi:hypothetical protein